MSAAVSRPAPIARVELRRGSPLQGGKNFSRIAWWLLLLEVLLIPLLLTRFLPGQALDWNLWKGLIAKLASSPEFWAMAALLPPVTLYAWAVKRHERLIISDAGLEYRSPFQGWLSPFQNFQPGWTLSWPQISAAGLLPPRSAQRPIEWKIVLLTKPQSRELLPLSWIDTAAATSGGLKLKDLLYRSPAVAAAVHASPLVRALQARGYDLGDAGALTLPRAFDLLQDTRSRILLALLAATGAYLLLDAFINPYIFVLPPAPPPYVAAAVTAGVLGWFIGRGLPALEHAVLTGLWAAAAAGAMHCGMLRANALTDTDGPKRHVYRQVSAGRYAPLETDLPPLEFAAPREFWASTPTDSEREFELTRGALDFWQVDMRPLQKEMREFFEKR